MAKGWGFMRGIGKSVLSAASTLAAEVNDTTKQATAEARKRRSVTGGVESVEGVGAQGESKEGVEVVPDSVEEDPSSTV